MEKDAYDSPTELQVLRSPNGLPSSLQIAGTMIRRRFPKFPNQQANYEDLISHKWILRRVESCE